MVDAAPTARESLDEEPALFPWWTQPIWVAYECPTNSATVKDTLYMGMPCGYTTGSNPVVSHGTCNGAACVGPEFGSTGHATACYCFLANGGCGNYTACQSRNPKFGECSGSPYCDTCRSYNTMSGSWDNRWGHDAGADGICNNADDNYENPLTSNAPP